MRHIAALFLIVFLFSPTLALSDDIKVPVTVTLNKHSDNAEALGLVLDELLTRLTDKSNINEVTVINYTAEITPEVKDKILRIEEFVPLIIQNTLDGSVKIVWPQDYDDKYMMIWGAAVSCLHDSWAEDGLGLSGNSATSDAVRKYKIHAGENGSHIMAISGPRRIGSP